MGFIVPMSREEDRRADLTLDTFQSIITVGYERSRILTSTRNGETLAWRIIPRAIAGFGIERRKVVTPDQMEVLEILGKR